jgi:hypothetical protein
MWNVWRQTAKTAGIVTANSEAPAALFRVFFYNELRGRWISWWQMKQAKAGRGAEKGL